MSAPAPPRVDVETAAIAHLRQQLTAQGYPDDLGTVRDLAIRCANAAFRHIQPAPRAWALPSVPLVIEPVLQPGVHRLRQAVEAGDDLTPFQSTRRLDADFHDHLLTDWGIHHFHLGAGQHATLPQFVARSGPVLFAFLTADRFLVLGIDAHGAWEDPELLQMLHSNWPEVLAPHRALGQVAGALTTAAEIKAFRKAGINGAVQLQDGTVYTGVNVGRATNGTPVMVVMRANLLARTVRNLQADLDRQLPELTAIVAAKHGVAPTDIRFQVTMVRHGDTRPAGFHLDDATTGESIFLQAAPAPVRKPAP